MSDSSPAVRVLLAASDEATLAGLRLALADGGFRLVAEVADAGAAADEAARKRPDVCLLDADMPGDVVAATAAIAQLEPGIRVVLLAARRDESAMLEAVQAGAVGYLLKDMDPSRLRHVLHGVTKGEAAIPRGLVTRLITEFRLREHGRRLPLGAGEEVELTAREWDVLSLLADGATTRDASAQLGIAEVTVRRHVSTAMAKLKVSDRGAAVQLVRAARRS
jgi:DNA-binding NarL/FixJ family response regulator